MTPQDTIKKEQLEKLEERLRSKAPVFPDPWQFVQRLKVKQEIEEEKSFLSQAIDATREATLLECKKSKDDAYHERDMLVCALSKLFPSYLARHSEEDKEWENDWRWIVYINIPTKVKVVSGDQCNHVPQSKWFETKNEQVSWHIHDSEREMFNHLEVKENNWDEHNTQRKYERLQALSSLTEIINNLKQQ